jgi:hypothetical protein
MKKALAHWEIKLVAIVLAVALWIYTSGQVRSDRTVDVTVREEQITGLGDNYQIRGISPRQFRVTLSVPSNRWTLLPDNDLLLPRLEVRPSALDKRMQEYSLTSAMLGLPSDIRIVRTEPENLRSLTVQWESIREDDLPVEPPAVENIPSGFDADVHLDVDLVKVRAGAEIIEQERRQKHRVEFRPIRLGPVKVDPTSPKTLTVALTPLPSLPYRVQRTPMATVTLTPLPASMPLAAVPVQVLLPREAVGHVQVDLFPALAMITVHGPENLLRELKSEQVTAYVDLRRAAEPGAPRDVPLALLAPTWLTFDPITVRATVTAAANAPAPPGEARVPPPPPAVEVAPAPQLPPPPPPSDAPVTHEDQPPSKPATP